MTYFVAFEGIDRSGKTTQINRLYNHLKSTTELKILTTREPWSQDARDKLKTLELDREDQLDLVLQDRANHCDWLQEQMGEYDLIFCDRFTLSTLAYQGYGMGINLYKIRIANEIVTQGLKPNLNLIIDCPISAALRRDFSRPLDKIERNVPFLEQVRLGYLSLAKNHVLINGNQPEDVVFNEVLNKVNLLLSSELVVQ